MRVGYAPGNWLLYAKAGVATTSLELSAISGAPGPGVTFSTTQKYLWGGTVGAGVEYMFLQHFIAGVEYDRAMFNGGGQGVTASNGTGVAFNTSRFDVQSFVGRLSYKF